MFQMVELKMKFAYLHQSLHAKLVTFADVSANSGATIGTTTIVEISTK